MKGRPILVAVAAFAIVLIGGVAMAGIGTYAGSVEPTEYASPSDDADVTSTTAVQKPTTTTIAEKEPEPAKAAESDHKDETKTHDTSSEEKKKEETEAQKPDAVFTLTHPKDGTHVKSKVVAFSGEASDGVVVHRGKYEAVPHEGKWAMELVLSPGKNHVSFEGVTADGTVKKTSVTVYYDAPTEEDKDKTASFTAHQKYGSCGEAVPYDVFYGTAKPGAKISASSAYGSNSTKANEHGKWEMKVKFPDSPVGKTFNISVKASTGQSKTFSFTNTGGGKDH